MQNKSQPIETVPHGDWRDHHLPDTLDLSARARLALNGMLNSIDPDLMTMYGSVFFNTATPFFAHWASADTLLDPKFAESIPLMRLICGSDDRTELEQRFAEAILSRVDDNLYWDRADSRRPWRNSYATWCYGEGRDEDFSTIPGAGRLLRTLLIWRELGAAADPDPLIRSLCRGLRDILVIKDDYGYYPEKGGWGEPGAYPRSGWLDTSEARGECEGGEGSVLCLHGHPLYAASHWYEQSGDPVALDLATRLANYCLLPRFWGGVPDPNGDRTGLAPHIAPAQPDPPFTPGAELGHWTSHFHARALTLRGLLAFGRATDDDRVLEFVRRAYEFSLTQGIARMGFVNCFPAAGNEMEGCAIGDLIGLAIRLSDAGLGDYWDDVDAIVRNHLMEQQLVSAGSLHAVSAAFEGEKQDKENSPFPGELSYASVVERSLGLYAGKSMPAYLPAPVVMQCCTSNASQGLYYAWEGALREAGDTATINLLLNRSGRLVDVSSSLPHKGSVEIRNRTARRLAVRIPAWIDKKKLSILLDQKPVEPEHIGRYCCFSDLPHGAILRFDFPLAESISTYTLNANTAEECRYVCTFRGSTLVDISPRLEPKGSIPIYRRDALRTNEVPVDQTKSFVPRRIVHHW